MDDGLRPYQFRVMRNIRARAARVADTFLLRMSSRPTRSGDFLCYFLSSLKESRFKQIKVTNAPFYRRPIKFIFAP